MEKRNKLERTMRNTVPSKTAFILTSRSTGTTNNTQPAIKLNYCFFIKGSIRDFYQHFEGNGSEFTKLVIVLNPQKFCSQMFL